MMAQAALVAGGFEELTMELDKNLSLKISNPTAPRLDLYQSNKKVLTLTHHQFENLVSKIPKIKSGFSFLLQEDRIINEFQDLIQLRQQINSAPCS